MEREKEKERKREREQARRREQPRIKGGGENSGGELSAIPGHKSTCTYRIASESFLYIPCSPQTYPRALLSSIYAAPRDPPIRCRHERLHVPLHGTSLSRISPIDLSNRSHVGFTLPPLVPLPRSLVWTDIFKMIAREDALGRDSWKLVGYSLLDFERRNRRDWIHGKCISFPFLSYRPSLCYSFALRPRRKSATSSNRNGERIHHARERWMRRRQRGESNGIELNRVGARRWRSTVKFCRGSKEFFPLPGRSSAIRWSWSTE